MKPLTRIEQRVIERAAVIVETEELAFSCVAISRAGRLLNLDGGTTYELRERYAKFYRKNSHRNWPGLEENIYGPSSKERKQLRILLLLWFLEVNS